MNQYEYKNHEFMSNDFSQLDKIIEMANSTIYNIVDVQFCKTYKSSVIFNGQTFLLYSIKIKFSDQSDEFTLLPERNGRSPDIIIDVDSPTIRLDGLKNPSDMATVYNIFLEKIEDFTNVSIEDFTNGIFKYYDAKDFLGFSAGYTGNRHPGQTLIYAPYVPLQHINVKFNTVINIDTV